MDFLNADGAEPAKPLSASAELKADAGAAAELNSSGTLTLKGALVQIN